ncbi:SDR family NAD(P)-dependent oxidoreductase [Flagellimonas hymeniacidonis]|uniref:SDR family NAD(P)-dependent oxidoreductase n=1 Tax=Flagellimonas hymeniacidonis TaxID=2603628 RepID=A0A5C8V729_9FLAO|nr:SDR family NAD(P)-dependent oxidoreductase [Flagellimonas hymeniacidonis]TXN37914.1 SDR family NAD(P)-dependent oxidoreductase [Flagellimonas hymeniacidonis]
MDLKLKDKTVFITGSTAGIGFATAKALLNEGAKVIVNGRTNQSIDSALSKLKQDFPSGDVSGFAADFGDLESAKLLCATLPELDILINNVGIYKAAPFFEMEDSSWYQQFENNVMSGVRLSRHFLPKMLKKNWGRILFISSECAELVPPDLLAYSMTKTAMVAIAKGLAQLTKASGVTVNSILPGSTLSEGAEQFLKDEAAKSGKTKETVEADFFKEVRTSSLLQRFATVDEVASTIAYYCSPLASATNGSALKVEGGSTGGLI